MNENCDIRQAKLSDAEAINNIANWYIENTAINFDTEKWSIEKRIEWVSTFNHPDSRYNLLVCESNQIVIGFACNTRFRPKGAYDGSTETTVYVANQIPSHGRAGLLYEALLELVCQQGFHRAYAMITQPNRASNALHQRLGFERVGQLTEIGKKFSVYHDVGVYQKSI